MIVSVKLLKTETDDCLNIFSNWPSMCVTYGTFYFGAAFFDDPPSPEAASAFLGVKGSSGAKFSVNGVESTLCMLGVYSLPLRALLPDLHWLSSDYKLFLVW